LKEVSTVVRVIQYIDVKDPYVRYVVKKYRGTRTMAWRTDGRFKSRGNQLVRTKISLFKMLELIQEGKVKQLKWEDIN